MMNQDPPAPCYLCDGLSTDTHHIVGGRGKRWVDTWNGIRVCRPCHRLIESDYNLRKRLRKERQDKIEWWLLQCPPKGKRIVYDRPEWVKERERRTIMKNIRETRIKLGLTQTDLAVKVGVSLITVRLWEKGISEPKPENLEKLKKVLGV